MFKAKKRASERFSKKDFFEVKKIKESDFVIGHKSIIKKYNFHVSESLEDIVLPKINEATFIISTKQRSSSIILQEKENIKECYILCNVLHVRYLKEIKLFLNGILIKDSQEYRLIKEIECLKENNIDFKFKPIHAKIIIWRIKDNFYVLEGSGNPAVNAKIENYIIFNNEEKYNLVKNFYLNA